MIFNDILISKITHLKQEINKVTFNYYSMNLNERISFNIQNYYYTFFLNIIFFSLSLIYLFYSLL